MTHAAGKERSRKRHKRHKHTEMKSLVDIIRGLPRPLRNPLYRISRFLVPKGTAELAFWKARWAEEGRRFNHDHYPSLMLAMSGEADDSFIDDKVIADFGCGPRGSLAWAERARVRLGIDVLATCYADHFASAINEHGMIYVTNTEDHIPIGSDSIDILFTLNAIDHVNRFEAICDELLRILKPGGLFVGSFNLNEPPAPCEPQSLDEATVKRCLLDRMDVDSYRLSAPGKGSARYEPLLKGRPIPCDPGDESVLWVRAKKPR